MGRYYGMVSTSKSEVYTRIAVDSFLRHTPLPPGDAFFLIDNDSTLEMAPNPAVNLLRNTAPRGFAANVNQILERALADGKDLFFLNNDIVFTPNWTDPLCAGPRAILVPLCNQYFAVRFGDWEMLPAMDLEHYRGHEEDLERFVKQLRTHPDFKGRIQSFPRIGFYCFLLPLEVGKTVGLFDEGFGPGGGEDVDYRIRANLAGFDVGLVFDSFVLHFMGKSTWRGAESPQATRQRDEQYFRYFLAKWGPDLAQIFLFTDQGTNHVDSLGLGRLLESGAYRELIEACLARRSAASAHGALAVREPGASGR
jgi:GT2 family glycosyltransferase